MRVLRQLKKYILITFISTSSIYAYALTENSKISVLTYEPGNELYTIFGHSAIQIKDSTLDIDLIYNFGTFDFSSPFFYIKFLRGELDYFLSIIDFKTFYQYSFFEERTIHEQVLNLDYKERVATYQRLNQIYKTDERFYKYDFFYDNCATRIRDVIEAEEPLDYDTTSFCCQSFRELLKPYISKNYWLNLGINLALGKEADKIASTSDFMFLPDYVYLILQDTDLVKSAETILDLKEDSNQSKIISNAILALVLILIITLSIIPKTHKVTFYSIHFLLAMVGLILLVLSLFSQNSAFRSNMDIMWTLPALAVLFTKKNIRKWVEIIYSIMLITLLLLAKKMYAGFSLTYIPWIICIVFMYLIELKPFKLRFGK